MKWLLTVYILTLANVFAGVVDDVAILKRDALQVKGDSMIPFLHENDIVVLNKQPFTTLKVGMVIVFNDGYDRIVHTIVSKFDTFVVTKGMNNSKKDNTPVTIDMYEGVVYGVFHNTEPLKQFGVVLAKKIK